VPVEAAPIRCSTTERGHSLYRLAQGDARPMHDPMHEPLHRSADGALHQHRALSIEHVEAARHEEIEIDLPPSSLEQLLITGP
jgi:hypothetical protein